MNAEDVCTCFAGHTSDGRYCQLCGKVAILTEWEELAKAWHDLWTTCAEEFGVYKLLDWLTEKMEGT